MFERMPLGADPVKASIYYRYLHRASARIARKEQSRTALERQIAALKKLNTPNLHQRIKELEHNLETTKGKQGGIRQEITQEEHVHDDLQEKAAELEGKLEAYLASLIRHSARMKELEAKVIHKLSPKEERVAALKKDIASISSMIASVQESVKTSQQRKKLGVMKRKLAALMQKLKKASR